MAGWAIQKLVGPVTLGRDPFFNDPRMFYDVILRRRNWANAAFCCGAASIHRREAVMQAALRSYAGLLKRRSIAIPGISVTKKRGKPCRMRCVRTLHLTPN